MAVDTAEKRFSMLNFGSGSHIYLSFETDGAVDLDDKQHLLDCYSGIAFGSAVVPPAIFLPPSGDALLKGRGGALKLSGRGLASALVGSGRSKKLER